MEYLMSKTLGPRNFRSHMSL